MTVLFVHQHATYQSICLSTCCKIHHEPNWWGLRTVHGPVKRLRVLFQMLVRSWWNYPWKIEGRRKEWKENMWEVSKSWDPNRFFPFSPIVLWQLASEKVSLSKLQSVWKCLLLKQKLGSPYFWKLSGNETRINIWQVSFIFYFWGPNPPSPSNLSYMSDPHTILKLKGWGKESSEKKRRGDPQAQNHPSLWTFPPGQLEALRG